MIETRAGSIDVQDVGSGEPVLFIHPFVTNGPLHWRKVVPLLKNDVRCITPTFPLGSHETAMKPDADLTPPGLAGIAVDVLDALGIEKATIVGNDTGGALAQIVASQHRDRVERLVLLSCDAYDVFPPSFFSYLKLVAATPGATTVLAQSMRVPGVVRLPIAYGWLSHTKIPKDVLRAYTSPLRDRGVRRDTVKVMKGLDPKHTQAAGDANRTLQAPTLVAWGADDRFFPRRLATKLAAEIPNAQLEIVEGARTFVLEDQPERFAELLLKFVATT